jgi:hypothetical protein
MIQSFNGLTVILDGKFSFYSYIIIKKWKMRIFDILPIAQLYPKCMYIEIIKSFEVSGTISDTIWIYATYRIIKSGVKPKAPKMRLYENKKDESIGSDSPF